MCQLKGLTEPRPHALVVLVKRVGAAPRGAMAPRDGHGLHRAPSSHAGSGVHRHPFMDGTEILLDPNHAGVFTALAVYTQYSDIYNMRFEH